MQARNETEFRTLQLGGSVGLSRQNRQEELAMRYLLGTLSEEERERLEERYFSEDGEFEEIEIAEEELIDKYVRGELSKHDRERFETTLTSSPRLMERVEVARVFAERLKSASSPITTLAAKEPACPREQASWWTRVFGVSTGSRAPRLAVAFSVLLILLGGLALFFGWLRLRAESRQLAAQQAALEQRQRELDKQAADLKAQVDQLANRSPQPTPAGTPIQVESPTPQNSRPFVALTLSPGGSRGEGSANPLRISPGTPRVQITLNVRDTDYSSYQAVVRTTDRLVSTFGSLRVQRTSSGPVVVFSIPANKLPPGDYSVGLLGRTPTGAFESVDDYQFRLLK